MADQQDDRKTRLTARALWALNEMEKHPLGITSRQYPGVRLSDCIFKLRKAGYVIETIREQHGGEFSGSHGRYRLINNAEGTS